MSTVDTIKRTLTEEHKLKLKEGRERASADKLAAEIKELAKRQKLLDKKLSKMTQQEAADDPIGEPEPDSKVEPKAEPKAEPKEPKEAKVKEPKVKENAVPAVAASPEPKAKVKEVKVKENAQPKEAAPEPKVAAPEPAVAAAPEPKAAAPEPKAAAPEPNPAVAVPQPSPVSVSVSVSVAAPAVAEEKGKKAIPKHVKTLVWNRYIGADKAKAPCMSCRQEEIGIRSFHCGHVIAEAKGGDMTINNLRPICAACNGSMGTMSMNEFTTQFFGWSI